MQYDEMLQTLQRHLGHQTEHASTVLAATVQAISEDAWQEGADLRAQLPRELAEVEPAGPASRDTLDEFVARISQLTATDDAAIAREYAQAGFSTLSQAISTGQLRQLMEALPEDYATLAPSVTGLTGTEETLLAEVRRQTKLDTLEQARELSQAVLAVLAEATSGGQAARLGDALPYDVGAYLHSQEFAQHTDTDRFLNEIIARSSVTTPELVREHTSGVLTTLRQWAPRELADTLDQLPRQIRELAS